MTLARRILCLRSRRVQCGVPEVAVEAGEVGGAQAECGGGARERRNHGAATGADGCNRAQTYVRERLRSLRSAAPSIHRCHLLEALEHRVHKPRHPTRIRGTAFQNPRSRRRRKKCMGQRVDELPNIIGRCTAFIDVNIRRGSAAPSCCSPATRRHTLAAAQKCSEPAGTRARPAPRIARGQSRALHRQVLEDDFKQ